MSEDPREFSFGEYVLSLFFAPQGYYRFIAFVITNVPYSTADQALTEAAALTRLRRGSVALTPEYRYKSFSHDHRIDELIYEFKKGGILDEIEILRPGRLPPRMHLENSGLLTALGNHDFLLN